MNDIIDTLVQTIEESAFPLFYAKSEYRQSQHCALRETQWLEEHLNEEEKAHLEQLRQAELRIATLEEDASIKTAIAAGIRFALAG